MSLVVNNNLMAANVARNLNAHYGRLNTSTQRLSSGLRVNSAADDAAGLAIRELQRADIAALHQGARNANDAISMIQVADGSLGIIDEKLIRMKELAEQAATGTYDSTQRLMIESEYQAMASEITRIANATDFNGTKLLDGTLAGDHDGSGMISEGKMKIHFGTGNDSAEDYYYIEIGECTSEAFGLGNNSTWQDVQRRAQASFKDSLLKQIKNDPTITDEERGQLLAGIDDAVKELGAALTNATDYKQAYKLWGTDGTTGFLTKGKNFPGNSDLMDRYLAAAAKEANAAAGPTVAADIKTNLGTVIGSAFDTGAALTQQGVDFATATPADLKKFYDEGAAKVLDGARAQGFNQADLDKLDKTLTDSWDTYVAANTFTAATWDTLVGATGTVKTNVDNLLDGASATGVTGATFGGDIALRNTGKAEYQADPTIPIGATDVAGVVSKVQDAFTSAMPSADALKAQGITFPIDAAGLPKIQKIFDAAKTAARNAAVAQGFTSAEADAVAAAINGTLAAGLTDAQWDTFIGTESNKISAHLKPDDEATDLAYIQALKNQGRLEAKNAAEDNLDKFWNGLRETEKQKLQYAWGQAAIYNLANANQNQEPKFYGIDAEPFGFTDILANDTDDNMLAQAFKDMRQKVGHMDFAGHTVETQEDAQMALNAINDAIVSKDKIRAHLGAAQNRLENTVTNLNIQAENLQAAESRISDVDVATEMTQFVRNQILTQSAVAMLSQANSLPQMAMQLIGG